MASLENDFLKISIRDKGAELTSVFDKTTGIEHLWQADPGIWAWHAPNLFPVVGACLNNQLYIRGKAYPMERHGFARQSVFTQINSESGQAVFSLKSGPQTLPVYPYNFEFQVLYALKAKQLIVTYRVINNGDEMMYFSVGAHPAFRVPFFSHENYADYYLLFEKEEKPERHLLSSSGYFNEKTEPVLLDGKQLHLSTDLFKQDALVFKQLSSRKLTLASKNHSHWVSVSYPDFPYLGIWAKPGAPFVCIEPWLGCADTEGKTADISQKEAIQNLGAGNIFEKIFTIGIGQ